MYLPKCHTYDHFHYKNSEKIALEITQAHKDALIQHNKCIAK